MPGCALIEYGASDELKAVGLLDHVQASRYVPIDIAASALRDMTRRLRETRPDLAVHPVAADFLQPLALPAEIAGQPHFGFFPRSTIGNLDRAAAHGFLVQARTPSGAAPAFLSGQICGKVVPSYFPPMTIHRK